MEATYRDYKNRDYKNRDYKNRDYKNRDYKNRDYENKDYNGSKVDFYFVYKSLAHPQGNGFVRPTTLEERLMHVETAKESLGTTIPWIVDTMDNDLKHAMGDRPNSEFIIGPDNTIVRMRDWSSADALRADLAELVGPVSNPTDPRSLDMVTRFEKTEVARGVVERVQPEGRMTAYEVETKPSRRPAYVKLRAEGDGNGRLYLGFFVDPIHKVHWNNQAGPVQVEVNGKSYVGAKVSAKADADPREFLVDVEDGPVSIKLKYVACDDAETWCNKVTQEYVVNQKMDRDAGRVSGQRPGGGGQQGARRGSQGARRPGFGGGRGFGERGFGGRPGFGGGLGGGRSGGGGRPGGGNGPIGGGPQR